MSYRSLLILLDSGSLCRARTAVATRLAKALDCHLVGLAPTGVIDIPASTEAAAPLAEFAAIAWRTLRDQAEETTQRFRDACQAADIKSFEVVIEEAEKAPSLVRHASFCDLTLLTQADPSSPNHRLLQDVVEQVVLYSARPTLILPHAGSFDIIDSNVLVAWDDSREATRALSDALPLLCLAKRVQVVRWKEDHSGDEEALRQRLDALRQWLLWKGVQAEVHIETTNTGIAEAMCSRAAYLKASLIVMGAYGHSRWSERVLGGATRGMLGSMTVPVLMSH